MKLIIIEGGDRLGKSTLIEGIGQHFNWDNVCVRHFGKPPKGMETIDALHFQLECFDIDFHLLNEIKKRSLMKHHAYYSETVIWNRSHLGEFVYSQMFRNKDPEKIKGNFGQTLGELVQHNLINLEWYLKKDLDIQSYLITLTADPEFFHSKEDGNSFSQKLEDKTKELELFKEAHEFSTIKNKLLIKVDQSTELPTGTDWKTKGPNIFRPKEDILNEVLTFIK